MIINIIYHIMLWLHWQVGYE